MDFIVKFGCPVLLTQTWQVYIFIAIPCLLSALGARLLQGSALRIVGATLGACARDAALLFLISRGYLVPTNPGYDPYCGAILLCCVGSGAALGSTFGPYRGLVLWILAGLGALAGHWAFTLVPLAMLVRARRNRSQDWVGV
ncbi:hypothetical protein JST97_34100 [bacterium]|nr:hypothetical protein [bacterium]